MLALDLTPDEMRKAVRVRSSAPCFVAICRKNVSMPDLVPAEITATVLQPELGKTYIAATRIHRLLFKYMNLRKAVLLDLDVRFTEFWEVP